MNEQEAFQLLTLASVRDGRQVTPMHAKVWAADLYGISFAEAVEAAREHYRDSTAWLMPAHVVRIVRAKRGRSLTMSEAAPGSCPDGRHRRLADGTCMFCSDRLEVE